MAKPKRDRTPASLVLDLVMLVLISVNIALLLFEWLFLSEVVQQALARHVPAFYQFYDENIHAHFLWIDLAFIAVFVIDLVGEWTAAVVRKTYRRWYYYPFVHWYDVLGCIPVGSFRFLRLLRVFSLLFKMQKLRVVDLRKTALYRVLDRYRDIAAEEVSDRVVVKILDGVQQEVQRGSPVTERILREVVEPRRDALAASLSERIQRATGETYALYKPDIRRYIGHLVKEAVEKNDEIHTIEQVPMVGKTISVLLERAISDIVYNVLDEAVEDLAAAENNELVNQVTRISTEALLEIDHKQVNAATREVVSESLELIKQQVRVQQWKKQGPAVEEVEEPLKPRSNTF